MIGRIFLLQLGVNSKAKFYGGWREQEVGGGWRWREAVVRSGGGVVQ